MHPLPEWIFGDDVSGERTFVIHTLWPRFIAELFDEEDSPEAVIAPLSVSLGDDMTLANFEWLDPPANLSEDVLLSAIRAYREYVARTAAMEDEDD